MKNLTLDVKAREVVGKKVKNLRKQELIPAILYGHNIKPKNLMVKYQTFEKIYKQAGESSLIDLIIDNKKPVTVIIQDVQYHPLFNGISHIDFHQIKMTEKLHAKVKLNFINEPPAVKELSGVLVTNLSEIEVECLPQDLVHDIIVDLSVLKTFEDLIHIGDLKIPKGIKVLGHIDDVIAGVHKPREEVAEKPAAEAVETAAAAGAEALTTETKVTAEKEPNKEK